MPVYRIREYSDQNLTKAGGLAPDTAGIGVLAAATLNTFRSGNGSGGGLLQFSADGAVVQTAIDGSFGNKTIVDGSATSLFSLPLTANQWAGGVIFFTVQTGDGTDLQADTGMATYSGVNKAGTITRTITYATANEAKAVSAGTLTLAFTATDDTNVMTVKLQPTGSLTETTYRVTYFVVPIVGGPVTIL